jgi:hypothetical protein
MLFAESAKHLGLGWTVLIVAGVAGLRILSAH